MSNSQSGAERMLHDLFHLGFIAGEIGRLIFIFSSRSRHTGCSRDWSSDVCSSDLKVLKIAKELCSLETPIGDEENSHLGDFIEDKNAILPIDAAIQSNLRETTTRTLALLTPREERVLRMRFGIGINKDHTLEEVGQRFSVTRERIRQIEAKALRKLKHPSRSGILRSFLHD